MIGNIHKVGFLRKLLLPLFSRWNLGDIKINHHYTKTPILLHSFRHKGYWFHGRKREHETMDFFRRSINPEDTVLEVGGHIGYISLYLSSLVGSKGKVFVFEPGSNNLPYIHNNTSHAENIKIVEAAVSNKVGLACFYEEELTGQNNSLRNDYQQFQDNRIRANSDISYSEREVETTTIDSYCQTENLTPGLIKIDIEGAEFDALSGAIDTISSCHPILVIEITEDKDKVYDLLKSHGYLLYNDKGTPIVSPTEIDFNTFALHASKHRHIIEQYGWPASLAA